MILLLLKKYKNYIAAALLILSFFSLCLAIKTPSFSTPFNAKLFQTKFEQSQWRVPNSKKPISDEELYTFAAYKYMHGESPILINPETPPFGKYLIGVSIVLFNNHHFASLFMAVGSLLLLFLITWKTTHSFLFSSGAVFLTAVNSIFTDQIVHSPQLDVFQLFFLTALAYLYLLYLEKKNLLFLALAGATIGAFLSLKVFLLAFLLINGWFFLYYILSKKKLKQAIIELFVLNSVGLVIFTATYFQYFIAGNSLRSFLGVQKWIFSFYSQSHIDTTKLFGNYLSLIFLDRWRFWSEGYPYVHYEGWSVFWPATYLGGVITIFFIIKKKLFDKESALWVSFFVIYNLFLFAVPIFPRYLVLLFPVIYLLIARFFAKITRV